MNNRIQLTGDERSKVFEIVGNYKKVLNDMDELQARMDELKLRKDELIGQLELNRADEQMLAARLLDKYGDGDFDPATLEWVTKQQTETIL